MENRDENGNLFAKFDATRPYDKVSIFTILEELLPVIASVAQALMCNRSDASVVRIAVSPSGIPRAERQTNVVHR